MLLLNVFSLHEWLLVSFLRLLLIACIPYCVFHLVENPPVLGMLLIADIFLLLFIGVDSLKVYEDRFCLKIGSLWVKLSSQNIFYYEDISKVTFEGGFKVKMNGYFPFLGPPLSGIKVTFRSGESKTLYTRIGRKNLQQAVILINMKL